MTDKIDHFINVLLDGIAREDERDAAAMGLGGKGKIIINANGDMILMKGNKKNPF